MTITDDIKSKIEAEYKQWENSQYCGRDKKERQKLGQFFTPPALTIRMLEKFDSVKDKDILDPTCGAGGLLVACIFAGADPKRIYGIELDKEIRDVCVKRLSKYGVPSKNIKLGNALDSDAYEFNDSSVTHDQNAYIVAETADGFEVKLIKFPAKIVKTANLNRPTLEYLIDQLIARNFWQIGSQPIGIKTNPRILNLSLEDMTKIAEENRFNSYDDIMTMLDQ